MDLKYNINKIHGDLINSFEVVQVVEKSNKEFGNYFEISNISEGKEVKMIITKKAIENDSFDWLYFSDPMNENSHLIERRSSTDTIAEDIKDIISKNKFSSDYLSKISK